MTNLPHRSFAAVLVLAFLAMAAPAVRAADAPAVHPLSEILVSGPTLAGLEANSVTVEADTKVPVICAVAFGTTTAYGALASDPAMNGGALLVHRPVLKGLLPDTTYQLRMQAVGPDGTVYVGDNFTLHTPAAAPAALTAVKPVGKNVALLSAGANIHAVSSNYGGGSNTSSYGANNAIDGNAATEWSSNGDGDKAWIELDLGKPYALTSIGFYTRTMGTTAQISSFQVITDQGQTLGPFTIPDAKAIYYFPVSATTRMLRFEVLKSSGGNTGASEIEVYAAQ
jgi:F5/8 type C domain